MDLGGITLLIGAIAGLVTVIGGLGMQVATFVRQGQMLESQRDQTAAGLKRDEKLAEVHNLVNGQSELLKKAAFTAGEKAGGDAERENPTVAAHPVEK